MTTRLPSTSSTFTTGVLNPQMYGYNNHNTTTPSPQSVSQGYVTDTSYYTTSASPLSSTPSNSSYHSSTVPSPTGTIASNGMGSIQNVMDFYIQNVNFSLHTKASPECEIQLYRLTNPMDAQITILNTYPQTHPPAYLSTVVYALQITLEKYISQTCQWVQCSSNDPNSTTPSASNNLFKDYDAFVIYNQTNQQSISQLIQTDGKSLYIQLPLQLGFYGNQFTTMTFRTKLNTSKEKQGYKRGESAIFRVVFSLLKQQQQTHTFFQNKYESIPFGIINHGKNSTATALYKNIKLSSIPGTVEYNMALMQQQQQYYQTPHQHSQSPYSTPNCSSSSNGSSYVTPNNNNYDSTMDFGQEYDNQQVQELLEILMQEEQALAANQLNQTSNEDYPDPNIFMTDDDDLFREITGISSYFTPSSSGGEGDTSQELFDEESESEGAYEDEEEIQWEDHHQLAYENTFELTKPSPTSDQKDDLCQFQSMSVPSQQSQFASGASSNVLLKNSGLSKPLPPLPSNASKSSSSSSSYGVPPPSSISSSSTILPPPPSMNSGVSLSVSSYNNLTLPPSAMTNSASNSVLSGATTTTTTTTLNRRSSNSQQQAFSGFTMRTNENVVPTKSLDSSRNIVPLQDTWSSPVESRESKASSISDLDGFGGQPRMTFGADYVRNVQAEQTQEKEKKRGLSGMFKKKKKKEESEEPAERSKQEKSKNPLAKPVHASFFSNFKPTITLKINNNTVDANNRQVTKAAQVQQKLGDEKSTTSEESLINAMSNLSIDKSNVNTKTLAIGTQTDISRFDPKKVVFSLDKKDVPPKKDTTSSNVGKGKKPIPVFKPGDIIQFNVQNNNEKELVARTSILVGTTLPRRPIVFFSGNSLGFTRMKENNSISSQVLQIPALPPGKKSLLVALILFVKISDSQGKERIFTNKKKVLISAQ
ncbi:hypothetical protein FDP41_002052 [Naegleria fowleri]|uniref:Uncharacterized protein n=1 Tax=Naegleria fowleri TaxID=5763 RepID=A0A6A5BWG8_NAEFO|nr:uncharacterized protein FDP41_002052 [Naegleria fowleri]KAF0978982.1 hypothetical protein FDP41_002052 [Naegleria fowleri]